MGNYSAKLTKIFLNSFGEEVLFVGVGYPQPPSGPLSSQHCLLLTLEEGRSHLGLYLRANIFALSYMV